MAEKTTGGGGKSPTPEDGEPSGRVVQPLVERLVVVKYLLRSARDMLGSAALFSAGLAVLQLQDAAEMLLRIVAEHWHLQIEETLPFHQLVDQIATAGKGTLTHRTPLNQLNKARVGFKHHVVEPSARDAAKIVGDMEAFFPYATYTPRRRFQASTSIRSPFATWSAIGVQRTGCRRARNCYV